MKKLEPNTAFNLINYSEEQKEEKWHFYDTLIKEKEAAAFDLANLKLVHNKRKALFKMETKHKSNERITESELETRANADDEISQNEMNLDVAKASLERCKDRIREFQMKHEEGISLRAYSREEMRLR